MAAAVEALMKVLRVKRESVDGMVRLLIYRV